jgi:hypothetical protein
VLVAQRTQIFTRRRLRRSGGLWPDPQPG